MVDYSGAAQAYTNNRTDDLANAWLNDAQKALATQSDIATQTHQKLDYAVIDNPPAKWKGVGLRLESAITIRYEIEVADLTDVKAVLTFNGKTFEIDASEFEALNDPKKPNRYAILFDELLATEMSTPVLATIYRGDEIISNTVQYSVESYVDYTVKYSNKETLKTLVKEMIKYGYSAYNYAS